MRNKLIILLIIFIFIMSIDFWGTLPKSQTDNETVEGAIARLVSAHNDETTAHTGGNRALEAHRSYDILDHKPGSVLADKSTFREIVHSTSFESITDLSTGGSVTKQGALGVDLYVEHGAEHESSFFYAMENPSPYHDIDYDFVFQTTLRFDLSTNSYEAAFGLGNDYYGGVGGFGFCVKANVLYACSTNGGVQTRTVVSGATLSAAHVYRAQYSAVDHSVDFYFDGELVATMPYNETNPMDDGGPQFEIKETASCDGYLRVANLIFARSLVN